MHGHLMQLVPLAWALRAAGHEVLVATPADFVPATTATGLPAASVAEPVSMARMISYDRSGAPVAWTADAHGRTERSGRGFARLAAHTLAGTRALVRSWRPDLVVSEPTEYSGPLAAGEAGVPWLEHWWGLAIDPGYRVAAESELAPELEELGLAGIPAPWRVLDVCPPSLQRPGLPERGLMRYVPYNGNGAIPAWVHEPRSRPRVCVTLGSVLPQFVAPALARAVAALDGIGAEIVLAADPKVVADLGPLPDSVRAAGWLPLGVVLPGCDLSVHHGGPGSTWSSFVSGLPQLVLPGASDTPAYARAVAAAGAGEQLDAADLDPFADACSRLLAEPSYRRAAGAVAREIASMPSPAEVVARLVL